MSTPEVNEHHAHVRATVSGRSTRARQRRRGSHRAGAIAATVVLLSGAGIGAAYGVTASASRTHTPEVVVARVVTPNVVMPVSARSVAPTTPVAATTDLGARVDWLVAESNRVVAEKAAAQRKAAEDAERAALAAKQAKQRAAAESAAAAKVQQGEASDGCAGKVGAGAPYWGK